MPNKKFFLKIFSLALFLSLAIFFLIKAAPPNTPYLPGETLDPNCAPGETNCTVYPPAISTRQIQTTSPLTGGGDLSQDRTLSLIGLSGLGSAHQILGVKSDATGLEYKNIASLLTAGSGISISGTDIATISNTGILSLTAGPGISISSGQNPTISNIGVLSLNNATGTLTLQGTTNQINVATNAGTITLSLPQDIATTSSPTFSGLTLSSLTPGSVLFAGSGGIISQDNSNLFWDATNKRLGIGTSTPAGILHVATGTMNALVVDNSGNVGIGTTAPDVKLDVGGDIEAGLTTTGSTVAVYAITGGSNGGTYKLVRYSSSQRYKENITDFNLGLETVLKLQPREFTWKSTGERDFGFIAEEAEKVNPFLITYLNGQPEAFRYSQYTAILTNAIKEQQKEIEELKLTINGNGNLTQNGQELVNSQPVNSLTETIKQLLEKLGLFIENGIAKVKEFIAEKVTTKQIFLKGDDGETICVDKNQLKQLLQQTNNSQPTTDNSQPTPTPTPTPEPSPTPSPSPTPELTPTPESSPTPTPEPTPTEQPTPTPSPSSTPDLPL